MLSPGRCLATDFVLSPRHDKDGGQLLLPDLQHRIGTQYACALTQLSLPHLKAFFFPESVIQFNNLCSDLEDAPREKRRLLYAGLSPVDNYRGAGPLEKWFWRLRNKRRRDRFKYCSRIVRGVKELEEKGGMRCAMVVVDYKLVNEDDEAYEKKAELCRCVHKGSWVIEEVWTFDSFEKPPKELDYVRDFILSERAPLISETSRHEAITSFALNSLTT